MFSLKFGLMRFTDVRNHDASNQDCFISLQNCCQNLLIHVGICSTKLGRFIKYKKVSAVISTATS